MKYEIVQSGPIGFYNLNTNFVMTNGLTNLIRCVKGVDFIRPEKYSIILKVPSLFTFEEVKQNISRVMNAYIATNPNLLDTEDKHLRTVATDQEFYRFLENY